MIRLLVPDVSLLNSIPWLRGASDRDRWVNGGPLCERLEQRIGAACDVGHVAVVSSGTAGLELALSALELPRGSLVLVPAFTFPATATAVVRAGLEPVYADVDSGTWALTPEIAADAIKQVPQIKAVVPVAPLGASIDLRAWVEFEIRHGVLIVADVAAALGNQGVPDHARAVFSLHATKPINAIEGGAVCSHDRAFIGRVRSLADFGFYGSRLSIAKRGTNARMSEVHAAFGLASFENERVSRERRKHVRDLYWVQLGMLIQDGILIADQPLHAGDVPAAMAVLLPEGVPPELVEAYMIEASEYGPPIETRRWYWPALDHHEALRFPAIGQLPNTRTLGARLLGLPFHTRLLPAQIEQVATKLRYAIKEAI